MAVLFHFNTYIMSYSKNYTLLPLVANWTYVYATVGVPFIVNVTCVNNVSMQSVVVQQICVVPITNLRLLKIGAIIVSIFLTHCFFMITNVRSKKL